MVFWVSKSSLVHSLYFIQMLLSTIKLSVCPNLVSTRSAFCCKFYVFTCPHYPGILILLQFHSNYMISSSKVSLRGKRYIFYLKQPITKRLSLSNILESCVVNMISFHIFSVLLNYFIIMCTHPRILF